MAKSRVIPRPYDRRGAISPFRFTPSSSFDTDERTADDENQVAIDRYGLARTQTGLIEKSAIELGLGQ